MAKRRPAKPRTRKAASGGALRRAEVLRQLEAAGRSLSAATVMFHTALAAKQGLTAMEEKALDVLDRAGPLTAGEIAAHTGLAPPSVTGLIDRLERKGFARRLEDPADRRRVRVERNPESVEKLAPLFADFAERLNELYSGYTLEELETILHFLDEVTRRQHDATAKLARPAAKRGR